MYTKVTLSTLISFSLKIPAETKGGKKKGEKKKGGKKKGDGKKKGEKKGSKKDKRSSSKDSKSSKRSGKSKKKPPKEKPVIERPKYVIPVDKPVGFAHLEWSLLPGRPKYKMDIVCWGPVAKIYAEDIQMAIKTYVVDDEIAWVPISWKHVFNNMECPELITLHAHVVTFAINTTKNKLGSKAKTQKFKEFYIRQEDLESSNKFVVAFEKDPNVGVKINLPKSGMEEFIESLFWECADRPGTRNYKEIVTRFFQYNANEIHRFHIEKIIERITLKKAVECKEFVKICPPPLPEGVESKLSIPKEKTKTDKAAGKKESAKSGKASASSNRSTKSKGSSKSKKSKKSKKGAKTKQPVILNVLIPGEVFFTDSVLSIYSSNERNSSVRNVFVLMSVKNLMSRRQKYLLNPLVIKLKKISNLPVDVLKENRFSDISLHYNFPCIAQCTSLSKPISKSIKFNEAHAHFTHEVPQLKMVEFMQTRRMYIEVRGIRGKYTRPPECNIFGTEKEDENFAQRSNARECLRVMKKETQVVTLAVACFDISSLLKPTWDFSETSPCHHPNNPLFQKDVRSFGDFNVSDKFNVNEINLSVVFPAISETPLSEEMLLRHGTSLKIEVFLAAPFTAALKVYSMPETYNRLIVFVNHPEIAKSLINAVLYHNQDILGSDILHSKFLSPASHQQNVLASRYFESPNSALTGFLIDNGNEILCFLEGLSEGFLSDVWNGIMTLHVPVMKTFYNGDYCFENRMYPELLKFGGVYSFTLKRPIKDLLNQDGLYLEGNVPIPCFRALQKLDLLTKSSSFKTIIQSGLLPSPTELASLDIEYGVPFLYTPRGDSQGSEELKDANKRRRDTLTTNAESCLFLHYS